MLPDERLYVCTGRFPVRDQRENAFVACSCQSNNSVLYYHAWFRRGSALAECDNSHRLCSLRRVQSITFDRANCREMEDFGSLPAGPTRPSGPCRPECRTCKPSCASTHHSPARERAAG